MNLGEIVDYLHNRRKSLRVSQKELAEIAGVSQHLLSDVESGKGNPTITSILKIADTLGVKITVGVERI